MTGKISKIFWVTSSLILQTSAMIFAKLAGLETVEDGLVALLVCPWFLMMLAAYAFQALTWLKVLTLLPLSVAYPFTALTVVLNLAASHFVFHETFTLSQYYRGLMIVAGVWLVVRREET